MRDIGEAVFAGKFFKIRVDANVDAFRTPAGAAGEVMVVVGAVGKAVHLGPVFANPPLHGSGLLEGLETSIDGNEIAGPGIERLVGFLGRERAVGFGQRTQDGPPLLRDSQACRTQGSHGGVKEMVVGVVGHESNLTKSQACVTSREQYMAGEAR